MQLFWIIGKTGILSKAFQRFFCERDISYEASSSQECDISHYSQLEAFAKGKAFTHILNCSAYTAVDLAEKEEERAFAVNAKGVENLALFAKHIQAKLVHFSTDYVFDGKKKTPYKETDRVHPVNIYGKSKERGEHILRDISPDSLVIRTSWVFSRDGHNFIKAMLKVMQEKEEIQVIEDQIGKPTYVEDLVLATLEILEESGVYHFANKEEVSRYAYAKEILNELEDREIKVKCKKILPISSGTLVGYAPRPAYSVLDTTKIEKLLKEPIRTHQSALKECFPYILNKESFYVS
jgi:dTDP-4-dehydrorhamnose reductase